MITDVYSSDYLTIVSSTTSPFFFSAISRDRLEISPMRNEERRLSTASAAKLFRSLHRQQQPGKAAAAVDDDTNSMNLSAGATINAKTVAFNLDRIGGAEILDDKSGMWLFLCLGHVQYTIR